MWSSDERSAVLRGLCLLGAVSTAGCNTVSVGTWEAMEGWVNRPAGYIDGQANFAVAVDQNVFIHTGGASDPERFAALGEEFRAKAGDTVLFDFDSTKVDPEAEATLRAQAAWLKANPMALMEVVGHADRVGADGYNMRLGMKRAYAVAARLVELGIDGKRLSPRVSMGERAPAVDTPGKERRNRRTVLVLNGIGLAQPDLGLDGKRAALGYAEYVADRVEQPILEAVEGG